MAAQAPEAILGTEGGSYELFTPGDVVEAGAAQSAPTYRFFYHDDIAPQDTRGGNLPLTLDLLPETIFEQGLQVGPFHTGYEGSLILNFATGAANPTLTVATSHTFQNGKKLTTRRVDQARFPSTGGVFTLAQFSSVTVLAPGPITFDDGTTGTITPDLLAQPVTVQITATISASQTETIRQVIFSANAGVSMWQLRSPILAAAGGDGAHPFATAAPRPVAASASVGRSTEVNRADHVHAGVLVGSTVPARVAAASGAGTSAQAARADHIHGAPPVPPYATSATDVAATAAAGTADTVSRGDHVHKGGGATLPPYSLTAQDVAASSGPGTANALSRGDHVHAGATIAQVAALANTVNRPTGAALQDGQVNTLDNCQGSGSSRHCTTEWRTPSGGGSGLPSFDGAGKHLATNADDNAAVWVTPPPDLTLAVSGNDDDIEALDFLTQDLIAGTPSTGWATVGNVNNVGIALFDGAPSCNAARGATYQPSFSAGIGGKSAAVRVKSGFALANARVEVKGEGETYEDLISGWALLCTSSDGGFAYYREFCAGAVCIFGTGVASLAMQTTGGAHIGTSKYQGDPTTVERWAIVGNSATVPVGKTLPALTGKGGNVLRANSGATAVEWDSAQDAVLAGLPAITGHGGSCLKANSAATGLEFAACGGSSGGSGGFSETTLWSKTANSEADREWAVTDSFSTTGKAAYDALTAAGAGLIRVQVVCGLFDPITTGWAWYPGTGSLNAGLSVTEGTSVTDFHPFVYVDTNNATTGTAQVVVRAWAASASCTGSIIHMKPAGGSGGSAGPSIPDPTAAGALKHLRVNAAGAAYELAALPAIPQGSSDTPKAASSGGNAGSSNKWSPSDHSHPLEANDTVVWGQVLVSTLTGGGASGGVDCDGAAAAPTAASCKAITDALRRGEYRFLFLRVIREDSDTDADPAHASGCALYPGVPGTILSDSVVYEAACTANSGKNSANTFNQYDVFVSFGNTGNFIQVRLPNYNSYGVSRVAVSLTGVR
ncbi:MAG: hypothetical protein OXI07_09020 [Gammaproteobacteria bacterium]|nr:hypothetical protein [Gammaproteobacteria bacterium]